MKVRWIRGNDSFNFNRPYRWFCLGTTGSGKSSFLESIGMHYLNEGHSILDLFGSRDGEGLAWLRNSQVKDKEVLLIHGDNVEVHSQWESKTVEQIEVNDFKHYDVIISASPLYSGISDEFLQAARLTDKIYKRVRWKKLLYCIVREAANFYYSRLKISDNQVIAKAEMIYLIRESRHVGMAMGIDSLRFYAVDIDIRNLCDYLVIKELGLMGLPADIRFLYSMVDPMAFRTMRPQNFVIATRRGSIGYGVFPEVSWHKQEDENILNALSIYIQYKKKVKEPELRGKYTTIGDKEHVEIIRIYAETGQGMHAVANILNRSDSTIFKQILWHNYHVQNNGSCPSCASLSGAYATRIVERVIRKMEKKKPMYETVLRERE